LQRQRALALPSDGVDLTATSYLKLDGIRKSFGKFDALKSVALNAVRGELMVFLGPSGCGKTTLLRIIAGLETQDAVRSCKAAAT
jgi:iron(III) transport system ATP-binding protein